MRTTNIQFEIMVDFMERHGDLTKPQNGPSGRLEAHKKWLELTEALNVDITGDRRSAEKWKKVWSDLKANTKRKGAKINKAATGTGGGPACQLSLSDLEQRVLNLIGHTAVTGLTEVPEVGVEMVTIADSAPPLQQASPLRSSTPLPEVHIQSFGQQSPPGADSSARPRSPLRRRSAGPSRSPRTPRSHRRSWHRRTGLRTTRTQALTDAYVASDNIWKELLQGFSEVYRELYSQRTEVLREESSRRTEILRDLGHQLLAQQGQIVHQGARQLEISAQGLEMSGRELELQAQALEYRARELELKLQEAAEACANLLFIFDKYLHFIHYNSS